MPRLNGDMAAEPLLAAQRGFEVGDLYSLGMIFAAAALFVAIVALSQESERPFSAAIVYLLLGAVLAAGLQASDVEVLDPFDDTTVIERSAELGVIVALFSAGLKLDRPVGRHEWRSATLLLAVVMPLTIAGVALLGVTLMGLSLGAAIALGAVLAPTDPVLAGEVQVGPPGESEEGEPQFALTAEAGLNDGLAFPFVFAALYIAAEGGTGWVAEWLAADVVYAVVVGIAVGFLAGRGSASLVTRLHARGILRQTFDGWLAIATVIAAYGLTEAAGAYGFLAAFAAGLAFGRYEPEGKHNERVHAGAATVERVGELLLILLLGSTVTLSGLAEPGLAGWALVLALLFVIRPLATLLAFAGSGLPRAERAFVAWFGIRGIGSFYYVAVVLAAGALSAEEARLVYWTVVATVGVSIILHGVSATPLARRLGIRAEAER